MITTPRNPSTPRTAESALTPGSVATPGREGGNDGPMMTTTKRNVHSNISSTEMSYIMAGCTSNIRVDGRSNMDHRPYSVSYDTNPTNPSAVPHLLSNGSSRVVLPGSSTDILCGIHAELIHPASTQPDRGVCELHIDILPFGEFIDDKSKRRKQETEISSILQHLLLPHILDWPSLVVHAGKYVWRLCIDIMVLSCSGSLIDACSLAIWGALQNLRLPKVISLSLLSQQHTNDKAEGVDGLKDELDQMNVNVQGNNRKGKNKALDDVIIDGDVANSVIPSGVTDCPLVITVYLLPKFHESENNQQQAQNILRGINQSSIQRVKKRNDCVMVVDATDKEELCATAKVSISADPSGRICGVHKHGKDSGSSSNSSFNSVGGTLSFGMLNEVGNAAVSTSQKVWEMLKKDRVHRQERYDRGDQTKYEYGDLLRGHFEWR